MITTSESIKTISCQLFAVQGAVNAVRKDAKNPHFKSNYASLEAVMDTVKPALQNVGVLLTQGLGTVVDGSLEVSTRLTHCESGEWLESTMHVPLQKRDPQGVGSAATYGLRYSIMALLGLPPVDDDGEAAIDRNPPKQESKPEEKKASSAEQKRGLEDISKDLLDCHTLFDVDKCGKVWGAIAKRDGWAADYKQIASEKFQARRDEINAAEQFTKDVNDQFPADREAA